MYLRHSRFGADVQLTFVIQYGNISTMNNAKLYNKSNSLQKRDAQVIVEEFSHLFDHKPNSSDATLLDIGCGCGDVLVELILPKLHENYTEVIGVDISQDMVKYASDKYHSQFLKFFKVDIQSDFLSSKVFKDKRPLRAESVDFITSFYCLHWIENQRWIFCDLMKKISTFFLSQTRQAISNIYKLLKPNGTCMLAFLASNPIFDIYLDLSKMSKYSKYMKDVTKFISPYHFEEKPLEAFSEKLYDVGFKIFHIEIRDQIFIFDDVELLKCKFDSFFFVNNAFVHILFFSADSVKAVNPFTSRMPENLQNDFLNDYVKKVDDLNLIQYNESTFKKNVITPYKLMLAIADK